MDWIGDNKWTAAGIAASPLALYAAYKMLKGKDKGKDEDESEDVRAGQRFAYG